MNCKTCNKVIVPICNNCVHLQRRDGYWCGFKTREEHDIITGDVDIYHIFRARECRTAAFMVWFWAPLRRFRFGPLCGNKGKHFSGKTDSKFCSTNCKEIAEISGGKEL